MLTEFAFTPSIFDANAHDDLAAWKRCLLVLGSVMFPPTGASAVLVSNLYGGGWKHEAYQMAKSVQDDDGRDLCLGLIQQFADRLVDRPSDGEWPGEESIAWAKEALRSNSVEMIDRIVACNSVRDALSPNSGSVRGLSEVVGGGFWAGIASQSSPPLKVEEQIKSLRKILLHSDFVLLISPYINNRDNDETEFARALIQSAFQRPDGWKVPEIEIHTSAPTDEPRELANVVQHTVNALRAVLIAGQKVRLVVWPKFLDRYLIGGVNTVSSKGLHMRGPRWGVSMSHIARNKDDDADRRTTSWSLLMPASLGDRFEQYRIGGAPKPLAEKVID